MSAKSTTMRVSITLLAELAFLVILVTRLGCIFLLPVSASSSPVGVKPGDWIKYEIIDEDLMDVDWQRTQILNVSGTEVTAVITWHYRDGTERNDTNTFQVFEPEYFPCAVIPPNMTEGEPLPWTRQGEDEWRFFINDTLTRIYARTKRTVNLLNVTGQAWDSTGEFTGTYNFYWDQITGILVEMRYEQTIRFWRAIETNMWFPTPPYMTIHLSSYDVIQGDAIVVSAILKDDAERPIEGATVNATLGDKITTLSDMGNGNYECVVDTAYLAAGTYVISVAAQKVGCEAAQDSQILTVKVVPLQVTIQLSTDSVTQGDVMTITALLKDDEGRPVEGAAIISTIGDKTVNLSDLGNGNYQAVVDTSDLPEGTYTVLVEAQKTGYIPAQMSENLAVEVGPTDISWILYGGIAATIVAAAVLFLYIIKRRS